MNLYNKIVCLLELGTVLLHLPLTVTGFIRYQVAYTPPLRWSLPMDSSPGFVRLAKMFAVGPQLRIFCSSVDICDRIARKMVIYKINTFDIPYFFLIK